MNVLAYDCLVTAGVGNGMDVTRTYVRQDDTVSFGTINTWVIVNGKLSDEAFYSGDDYSNRSENKSLA